MATSTEAGSTSQSVHDTESASSVALSSHDDTSSQEGDNDGTPKLTQKWLLAFLSKDWKQYYRTFELNERLYLHFKGFGQIRCIELFPELKTLYFEGNGLAEISGLETNSKLRCLYLHENCVQRMEGLDGCVELANLNLSDNMITTIEGIGNLDRLDMLYLARNRIGRNGISDLRGLLECPSITTVDLQHNKIADPAVLEEIFVHMPNLKVLYLQGNEVTNKIKNYRKTIIARLPELKYLDDRPVFEDDRRNAEAFSRGGIEEERAERQRIAVEKSEKDERNRVAFKDMIKRAREEKRLADEASGRSASPANKAVAQLIDLVEESPVEEEQKTVQINTCDDDAPPELEQVDADKLKKEQEAMSDSAKQQKQMYDQMRKNIDVDTKIEAEVEEEEEEGCTVEEVVEEAPKQEEPAATEEENPLEELVSMADMLKKINVEKDEPEFVSALEELD